MSRKFYKLHYLLLKSVGVESFNVVKIELVESNEDQIGFKFSDFNKFEYCH